MKTTRAFPLLKALFIVEKAARQLYPQILEKNPSFSWYKNDNIRLLLYFP